MKKQNFSVKCALGLFLALGTTLGVNAQLFETMGTVGSSPETIATHETNNRFDEDALTYTGTADLRNNTFSNDPTSGIPGASGAFNVLIQAQETFEAGVINALACDNADSLTFLVHKNFNASNGIDFLVVEFSTDGGGSWTPLSWTALPTGSGSSHWYRRAVALPAAAQSATLSIRFRSTLVGTSSSNPQFRIDDVAITCGSDVPCEPGTTTVTAKGSVTFCQGSAGPELTVAPGMAGTIQWYNQSGAIAGADDTTYTPTVSGTYYAIISNENGCTSQSNAINVYAYPQPEYCLVEGEACVGDTITLCVTVDAYDLIISQYMEGSGFNKYLEIYNGTCGDVNLGDYQVRAYHNGASTPNFTIPLSGTLASGATFVIAHRSATAWTGTPDLLTDSAQWNGNDAIGLFKVSANAHVDIFGSIGNDPGSSWRGTGPLAAWETEDKTLVRRSTVYAGVLQNPGLPGIGGFPTLFTEWDTLSNNDPTGLGSHGPISANSYSFAVASGSATIDSTFGNCFNVAVTGTGTVTVSVNGDFGNGCRTAVNAVSLNSIECEARSAAVSAGIRKGADMQATAVYPNPFTNAFTVSFTNSVAGEVSIQVVDMYGKSLSVLNNQRMEAGTIHYQFDASALAAGTYICRIQTAAGQETVRIIKSN